MKAIKKFQKQTFFIGLLTTNLVFMTFMTKQPLVHEKGRPRGRLSGRKCGDVDDYLSDHGIFVFRVKSRSLTIWRWCLRTWWVTEQAFSLLFLAWIRLWGLRPRQARCRQILPRLPSLLRLVHLQPPPSNLRRPLPQRNRMVAKLIIFCPTVNR